jgi:processive 1,2-diacylglycerol beta-glucosyltransferase
LPLELLVVTGRNRGLYRRLKKKKFNLPIRIYGKVDNISELMAASDIIITKAGGVTISELLASGLPAILWDIIPGQEEGNSDYLVNAGVAVKIKNISDIRDAINKVVLSQQIMARCSQGLGKPNSTMDAVGYLRNLIHV